MSQKTEIRAMTPGDIPEVIALGLITPELQDHEESAFFSHEQLLRAMGSPDDLYLVATANGQFAGFSITTYNPHSRIGYLMDISIKAPFRKSGIGKMMLDHILEKLKALNCEWYWCLVHEDNLKMQSIMQRRGFAKGRKFFVMDRT